MENPRELKVDDVSFSIDPCKTVKNIAFHDGLNVLFVKTNDVDVRVVDPTVGEIIYNASFGNADDGNGKVEFGVVGDKVVVTDDCKLGIRSEYKGIVLLDTILQAPAKDTTDLVQLELNINEAESLCHSLAAVDASNETDTGIVEKQLKAVISKENETQGRASSVKKEKWSTVKLELPYSVLKSTFQSMVTELWKKNAYIPQLSIASSILERLNMLLPSGKSDADVPVDKALMFSESSRLGTFHSWPHKNYKWALPEKMAQAGFYHNPNRTGEDRALCFTCNVCLVSWEPTDEPWSEHERHSPFCPFVRGEHTHNVPLHLTYATLPAFSYQNTRDKGSPILGKSVFCEAIVIGHSQGSVIVYDIASQVKEVLQFHVKATDLTDADTKPLYCDVDMKPKEAWVMNVLSKGPPVFEQPAEQNGILLSSVSIIGSTQSEKTVFKQPCVVVGLTSFSESNSASICAAIVVYQLLEGTLASAAKSVESGIPTNKITPGGNTGTKQEAQMIDDLHASFVSDTDLFSESMSEFCDSMIHDSSLSKSMELELVSSCITPESTIPTSAVKLETLAKKAEIITAKALTSTTSKTPRVGPPVKLIIPPECQNNFEVSELIPTPNGALLIAVLNPLANSVACGSAVLVYKTEKGLPGVTVDQKPVATRFFVTAEDRIISACYIPPDVDDPALACVFLRGDIGVFSLVTLEMIQHISPPSPSVLMTCVTFCSSLERLCCGTNEGTIELVAVGIGENENSSATEEIETDTITRKHVPTRSTETVDSGAPTSLLVTQPLNLENLKKLVELTSFENANPGFTANVPSCWTKINQAQKDRKHPQHLQHHETEISPTTLSWRLQRNKYSRKEHLFELSLPSSSNVGHIDLKFILQLGWNTLPPIEVTLYRAAKLKTRAEGDAKSKKASVKLRTQSSEFLKSINAEIVCGPLDLGYFVDLSGQGGNIVMTSPALMLSKGRNFYLHLKAKQSGKHENSSSNSNTQPGSSKSSKTKTDVPAPKFSTVYAKDLMGSPSSAFAKMKSFQQEAMYYGVHQSTNPFLTHHPIHKAMVDGSGAVIPDMVEKKKDFGGCDWLNEISITIRPLKATSLPHETQERKGLLMSEEFLSRVVSIAAMESEERSLALQSSALDLLVWIAAVNLCGPQIGDTDYQSNYIRVIQKKLLSFVTNGVLFADRSTSHKAAKILILCIEAAENYLPPKDRARFPTALLETMLELLPWIISCDSAGSLQWFFLILNRVRSINLSISSECLLDLMKDISEELRSRADPMHALLRTRFGLYGTPFEPELFEIEVPTVAKSHSYPLTYAGVCNHETASTVIGPSSSSLPPGTKDVDFRELLTSGGGQKSSRFSGLPPKQHIQGLLEIEPLHFTCHAASDGTRLEKIDTSLTSFSTVPLAQPWESSTNLPTGEGSKKAEADKMEQIMMLHKALKMDTYYDALHDFQYIGMAPGSKLDQGVYQNSMATEALQTSQYQPSISIAPKMVTSDPNWKNIGVLTMVMQDPASSSSTFLPSGSNKVELIGYMPGTHGSTGSVFSNPHPHHLSNSASMTWTPKIYKAPAKAAVAMAPPPASKIAEAGTSNKNESGKSDQDGLRLLLSPWQQMMYVPPQQAIVIDRMHSGARRFVVLDFGAPVVLTDMVIPSCSDLVSLSVDIWLHREETDGQRLVVVSDIGARSLMLSDLQPPPVCRYLKITIIGRYGMGTTKCRIPVGMFYGHTVILPTDIGRLREVPADVPVCTAAHVQPHLAVLSSLIEDIGCRYHIACDKLKRLLEPLLKPEITSLDHVSYYLPRGKERNKLGFAASTDQAIMSAYQECTALQEQLNVARNVVRRLQKSLQPYSVPQNLSGDVKSRLKAICTDKIHVLSDHVIESLLGISFIASVNSTKIPTSLYTSMDAPYCESLFRNICVLESGQCQLSACTLMLRVGGFQPWWGNFLATTLKNLFSSRNQLVFPQDRVFILLVYLGQKALTHAQNSSVIESAIELIRELLQPLQEAGFLSSKIDMSLFGWVVMFLCLCLDGINCTFAPPPQHSTKGKEKEAASSEGKSSKSKEKGNEGMACITSRWDFIQGESALYRRISGAPKSNCIGLFKRRIQKKLMATKQKLEELDSVASGLGYPHPSLQSGGLGNQLSALGNKIEAIKQKQASIGKSIKLQSSKHFKDLLQIRRSDMLYRRGFMGGSKDAAEDGSCVDLGVNLNLDPTLCLIVARSLSVLLLRMDSTCHSDVYLIVCKALARIATACRPALRLSEIFNSEQLVSLILTAVGGDYVRQRNWSSSWISHAIMCLIQDILEGERIFPVITDSRTESMVIDESTTSKADYDNNLQQQLAEDAQAAAMMVDEIDSIEAGGNPHQTDDGTSLTSDDDGYDDVNDFCFYTVEKVRRQSSGWMDGKTRSRKNNASNSGVSSALDSRLENGIESTVELRLRLLGALNSEVLVDALKAPLEIPDEVAKNLLDDTKIHSDASPDGAVNSCKLLESCFEHIFDMMSSETCSVSIVKVLQLWISINMDLPAPSADDSPTVRPSVPLSQKSVTALMSTLTKNNGIGVQEWGLAFQCLALVLNQKNSNVKEGDWLLVLQNQNFPEIILRFISGSGMNLQKSHLTSVGPTVCQQFYNFLTRLRELSHDSAWTNCLKEILLRVLCAFLSGPFLETDFPMDAFNKFLDRVTCPDLSYENPSTVCRIIQEFAQALHVYVFFPNKITIRSAGDMRNSSMVPGGPAVIKPGSSSSTVTEGKFSKNQDFEQIMFRLVSFAASCLALPFKENSEEEVSKCLSSIQFTPKFVNFDTTLVDPMKKFGLHDRPKSISDVVLRMDKTMMRVLSVLANPNGINVLASGDLAGAFNILENSTPTTVVDAVIHFFCKLCGNSSDPSSTIQPLFRFLSKSPYDDFYCPLIVSETFVLMVLKVISNEAHLKEFTELKCVEAVCDKLISSTKKFFSSCPTFVSILTQYIGRNDRSAIFGQKKFMHDSLEVSEGLINAAPLGSISSTSFSANPSEVLLQATAPHRRARTPVWSYHFLPEESFLELIITLPCAILLKEVQILPHITTSFSTCPSAVMVEISRDRSSCTLPMGPPVQCGGLSSINIQLTSPEVAQTVLLRVFKPKDSSNLGLSQIRLLGCTTFSEAALEGLSAVESTRNLEASAQWMYILDRAITVSYGQDSLHLHRLITETAIRIPDMLESCYSMLVAPVPSSKIQEVYLPHVASVLFQFGSLNKEVSKQLMLALLGPVQHGFSSGMVANASTQYTGSQAQLHTTVELVYKLCCNVPFWGGENLLTLIEWLEKASQESIPQSEYGSPCSFEKKLVVPEYVQSVSAILWSLNATGKTDLTMISTPSFFTKLLRWAETLDPRSELKASLDHVICSLCYVKPWLLVKLMWELGMIKLAEWSNSTDSVEQSLYDWYEEGSVWGHLQCKEYQELSNLDDRHLLSLARAALSPVCCNILEASELLLKLNGAIMKFWAFYNAKWSNTALDPLIPNDVITPCQMISILRFYSELCRVNHFKTWFGGPGSIFWFPLLNLLSSMPESLKSTFFGTYSYDLESTVISFLAKCCWSHPENQAVVATCLCDIIAKQKQLPHKAVFLHSMSSFCRRLLLQLLLENEKVVVHIKNATKHPLKNPESALPIQQRHPSMGVNEGDRIFLMSTHSYVYDILKSIEPRGAAMDQVATSSSDRAKFLSMLKKEQGIIEAGLEMIDQMQLSITGNVAKEKRAASSSEKRPFKTAAKKLKPESGSTDSKSSSKTDEKSTGFSLLIESEEFPGIRVPTRLPTATLMAAVRNQRSDLFLNSMVFTVRAEGPSPIAYRRKKSASDSSISVSPPQSFSSDYDPIGNTVEMELETSLLKDSKRRKDSIPEVFNYLPLPSTIEVFSQAGGFGLLAKHLPVVYPETLRQMSLGPKFGNSIPSGPSLQSDKGGASYVVDNEWAPVGSADDIYEEIFGNGGVSVPGPSVKKTSVLSQLNSSPGIPPHSMAAFGLFLSLPRFSEVLLGERIGAQCMLRLVMGVTDDAEGNDIFGSAVAKTLPTLPFQVLRCLLDVLPASSEEGKALRKAMIDVKAVHFILACLAVFTHQNCDSIYVPGVQHELVIAATKAQGGYQTKITGKSDDKSHVYWAKGTGFGTGSTTQSWDVELALQKKKQEEEHVTSLLLVLSSFIQPKAGREKDNEIITSAQKDLPGETTESKQENPGTSIDEPCFLPVEIVELLKKSCLFPAISAYLRNDSVLDMARHVPLYRAVLQFLRALVSSTQLASLLVPLEKKTDDDGDDQPISYLLSKMKDVVDNYSKRLLSNRNKGQKPKSSSSKPVIEDLEDEGLAMLIPDIQGTAVLVQGTISKLTTRSGEEDVEMKDDVARRVDLAMMSVEDRYTNEMRKLQFAFYDMITEDEDCGGIRFTVGHHYEGNVRHNWTRSAPTRLKRLAQESVTLSTSLPIAYGSTIFVRCDTDRLDVMKVLITGPAGTPYANGCFEFDVFFPSDYPNSPLLINLETTGRQRVRFNPNLYNDGKVCLSILNTWHGRPEEKWNPQTSSLLPVLVAIQSLILNAEPYFNEPGYEKSRGTENGEKNAREYNAGIQIATVEWAMLDQLRHPSPCFKDVIQRHFWMKRDEVISQCEKWLEDLVVTCRNDKRAGKHLGGSADPVAVFKNNFAMLKKELCSMKPPIGLEDMADSSSSFASGSNMKSESSKPGPSSTSELKDYIKAPDTKLSDIQKPPTLVTSKEDKKEQLLMQMNKLLAYEVGNMDTEDPDIDLNEDSVVFSGVDALEHDDLDDEEDDDDEPMLMDSMDFT